jgi:hypothetical protein
MESFLFRAQKVSKTIQIDQYFRGFQVVPNQ